MRDEDFYYIQRLADKLTGIQLGEHKRDMVYSRIVRRIRALKLPDFSAYCHYLENHTDEELTNFVNAITTNLTAFFREPHHFDFLKKTVIPELLDIHRSDKRVRGWSAGCSTGEEPYSIAQTLREGFSRPGWDVKLLATDLDSNVVATAKSGLYRPDRVNSLQDSLKRAMFDMQGEQYQVKPELQRMITFKQLNLLHDWPMKGPLDFIFCRNVVIYFNKDTQRVLFDRYANLIRNGGYLFIGHSESLHGVSQRFRNLGRTIYQKIH